MQQGSDWSGTTQAVGNRKFSAWWQRGGQSFDEVPENLWLVVNVVGAGPRRAINRSLLGRGPIATRTRVDFASLGWPHTLCVGVLGEQQRLMLPAAARAYEREDWNVLRHRVNPWNFHRTNSEVVSSVRCARESLCDACCRAGRPNAITAAATGKRDCRVPRCEGVRRLARDYAPHA